LSDRQAKGEVTVVIAHSSGVLRVGSIEKSDLAEHGISIDKHFVANS
jgi:hypothetical protein